MTDKREWVEWRLILSEYRPIGPTFFSEKSAEEYAKAWGFEDQPIIKTRVTVIE
jgi:hypothetical protein